MSSAATDKREEGDTKNIGFYDLGKVIGAGAYSKVRLATHVSTNQVFAVKIVDKSRIHNVKDLERVLREMHVLKNISHPNIISMHECIERGTKLFLVLDFASGGELYNYVVSKGKLQELEARQFFTQIMSGVDFCHRQEISHRDLKPENILLVEQDFGKYVCKIADFGLSNDIKPGELLKTICGTPCYAAPEIIMGQKYDGIAIDLWSLGATLYTLVVGRCPFRADNQPELFNKIQKGIYSIPSSCSPEVSDLIRGFMKIDSKKRIHISKVSRSRAARR
ncbi:hypothetical protein GUITHDRAFT_79807 [Guillardia theta CCMP2712]|uniref:Protein kinase domain-containing protein n=1 Tax=Guillardia theta (strain CCMP2712) TaxID=905079 RepID=L1IHG0_GUITC|nr:hypothetical protein GUITHDRAFT_79807 [Guillardia theta CCMP2712]EKX35532.1 hypothetical protein GUITHDRAFT_79807 [Guillardia theta CCMP2712]|eukprot:XP_005822512.1 hypothetical protein GUITHDRAFT_79807 [Guillardia theta CCMP2712]